MAFPRYAKLIVWMVLLVCKVLYLRDPPYHFSSSLLTPIGPRTLNISKHLLSVIHL